MLPWWFFGQHRNSVSSISNFWVKHTNTWNLQINLSVATVFFLASEFLLVCLFVCLFYLLLPWSVLGRLYFLKWSSQVCCMHIVTCCFSYLSVLVVIILYVMSPTSLSCQFQYPCSLVQFTRIDISIHLYQQGKGVSHGEVCWKFYRWHDNFQSCFSLSVSVLAFQL